MADIGEAVLPIVPEVDTARFERDLQRQLVAPADRAGDQISRELREAFGDVDVTANRVAESVAREFDDTADDIVRDFDRAADKATGDLRRLDRSASSASGSVGGLGGNIKQLATGAAVLAGVAAAARGMASALGEAADLSESINAVQVVLGDASESFLKFGEDAVQAVGVTQAELNAAITPMAGLLTAGGLAGDELSGALQRLAVRAADTGSVLNTDVNEVLAGFGAALRGEAEPARRFNVQLTAAAVNAEAVAMGLAESTSAVSEQAKVQARLSIIMRDTDVFAGDFARTADSLPNVLKRVGAEGKNLLGIFGQGFLDEAQGGAAALEDGLVGLREPMRELGETIGDTVGPRLTELIVTSTELAEAVLPAVGLALEGLEVSFGPVLDGIATLGDIAAGFNEIANAPDEAQVATEEFTLAVRQLANRHGPTVEALQGMAAAFQDVEDEANAAAIEGVDRALADLVRSGHADDAAFAVERLIASTIAMGGTAEDVTSNLEAYAVAVHTLDPAADQAADRAARLANVTDDLAGAGKDAADEFETLSDALDAIFGAALSAEEAVSDYEAALDDLASVAEDGNTTLDLTTEAGRRNRDAFRDVVETVQERIELAEEQNLGEEETNRILLEGARAFREQGRAAGFTDDQIDILLRTYGYIPDEIVTSIALEGLDAVLEGGKSITQIMRELDGTNVTVGVGATGGGGGATGSTTPAPTSSADQVIDDPRGAAALGRTAVSIGSVTINESGDARKTADEVILRAREQAFLDGPVR